MRLDQGQQRLSQHHLIHLGQDHLAPPALAASQIDGVTE
jgi:hypothetical protein